MMEFRGPGGILSGNLEERAREFIDMNLEDPLLHLCIQVHSTYTTTEEMLQVAAKLAAEYKILFITHASESKTEVETVTNRFGKTPIEYLYSRGLLGARTLLAHCVHLRDDEIALLHETETSVAHCPESNLKIGNGVARVPAMLKAGVNVALGTDGAATNNDLDMFGEMRTAALLHKGINSDPTVLPAEEAFAMATIRGARAFGLSDRIGSIEVGKLADIAIVDLGAANVTPLYNVYSHLCYAVDKNDVRTVFIHGKLVMEDRKLLTLDEEEIKAKVREIARAVAEGVDM
jgi:5-methylthioadenosine/S-adenosylhomocysteine deaminase